MQGARQLMLGPREDRDASLERESGIIAAPDGATYRRRGLVGCRLHDFMNKRRPRRSQNTAGVIVHPGEEIRWLRSHFLPAADRLLPSLLRLALSPPADG